MNIENLNKESDSTESEPLIPAEGTSQKGTLAGEQSTRLSLSHLADIEQEVLEAMSRKRQDFQESLLRNRAESAIAPGIYHEEGITYYVIPKSFTNEDSVFGPLITDLAILTQATVKTVPFEFKLSNLFDKQFILGAWFGIFSTTNQRRSRSKKQYELGRTCTFSLIVKNYFESNEKLGSRSLARDNFFFGNNQKETSKKHSVLFCLKNRLRSYFDNPIIGDLLFGVISDAAKTVGFGYLQDDEVEKTIKDHIIPIETLITSYYPEISVKKKGKEEKKVKKPNPIRASPLYLPEEMRLISDITSLIFGSMSAYNKSYIGSVMSLGFSSVEKRIKEIISDRNETLQRFASRTKLRLQAIRKIIGSTTLKKAAVSKDNVTSYLNSLADPCESLVSEMKHIAGRFSLSALFTYKTKSALNSDNEVHAHLYNEAIKVYTTLKLNEKIGLVTPKKCPSPRELEIDNALKVLHDLNTRQGVIQPQLKNLMTTKSKTLFGRFKQVNEHVAGVIGDITKLLSLNKESVESALIAYYEDYNLSFSNFSTNLKFQYTNLLRTALQALQTRYMYESAEEEQNFLDSLIKNLGTQLVKIQSLELDNIR